MTTKPNLLINLTPVVIRNVLRIVIGTGDGLVAVVVRGEISTGGFYSNDLRVTLV